MINTSKTKILLTSAGFDEEKIRDIFLGFVGKPPKDIKVLFIPTAAIDEAAIRVLPLCMDDLLKSDIPAANIRVFDLHRSLSYEELTAFDGIYFTGGSTQYLLERINATGFNISLNEFVNNGGVYVGVSAGSCVAAGNLPDNLGYLRASLRVHTETVTDIGIFDNDVVTDIDLTDKNAVIINNGKYEIV